MAGGWLGVAGVAGVAGNPKVPEEILRNGARIVETTSQHALMTLTCKETTMPIMLPNVKFQTFNLGFPLLHARVASCSPAKLLQAQNDAKLLRGTRSLRGLVMICPEQSWT